MNAYRMKSCSIAAMSIALITSSTAAADEPKGKAKGQLDMGFTIQTMSTFASQFAPVSQTILMGGKFYRFSFGLGIELTLFPPNQHYAADIGVALLRTSDKRVELIASSSAGFRPPESYEPGVGNVRVRLGLGARYWPVPRVGVHITTGVMHHVGLIPFGIDSTGSFVVLSSYGQVGMMAVF